jgi:hypothetical protein
MFLPPPPLQSLHYMPHWRARDIIAWISGGGQGKDKDSNGLGC